MARTHILLYFLHIAYLPRAFTDRPLAYTRDYIYTYLNGKCNKIAILSVSRNSHWNRTWVKSIIWIFFDFLIGSRGVQPNEPMCTSRIICTFVCRQRWCDVRLFWPHTLNALFVWKYIVGVRYIDWCSAGSSRSQLKTCMCTLWGKIVIHKNNKNSWRANLFGHRVPTMIVGYKTFLGLGHEPTTRAQTGYISLNHNRTRGGILQELWRTLHYDFR